VKLYYAEKQDVNLDGLVEEWLMVFDDGVYTVVPDGSHYKALNLSIFGMVKTLQDIRMSL